MGNNSISISVGSGCRLTFQRLAVEPTVRFFNTDIPSEIFATLLPVMTFTQPLPVPRAVIDGPTSFGSYSVISLKTIINTPAKVLQSSELFPNFTRSFASYNASHNLLNSLNESMVGVALNQRVAQVNTSQLLFQPDSRNLPPGQYKLQYRVVTWYQGAVEGNVTFDIANADAPTALFPIQVPDVVFRNQILQISASVVFSACSQSTTPVCSWRVRDWEKRLISTGSQKLLTIPQFSLSVTSNSTYFVELVVNGLHTVSAAFSLSLLPPVAIISGGEVITIGASGGRISAEASYDPNFGPNEQPTLLFSWSCSGLDLALIPTSLKFINLPALSSRVNCTLSVSRTSGSVSSASVEVVPVAGSPPVLTIKSSLSKVASNQNVTLSVLASPGLESQVALQI